MDINLLTYYNKSLLKLLEKIKQLQTKSFLKPHLCFEIQVQLIKRIKYIEKQIRYWKKRIKNSHDKQDIKYFWHIVEEYRFILYLFKSIGDCIAYIFIDRWDIKPLNYKKTPGFISDKTGFAEEYRILRKASA